MSNEPQDESCPATHDARGIAPIPCALPLGHAGEHRSKGGTTWAGIVPQFNCPECRGLGTVDVPLDQALTSGQWSDDCHRCDGTGKVADG